MSITLRAENRSDIGSSATKKIRKQGNIPAIIYSKDQNTNIMINAKEFEHEYFKGLALTSIFTLELKGKKIKTTAHKIDLDPVSDRPIHIDFMNCEENKVFAQPKILFSNQDKSPGLKKGGFLHVVIRKLKVVCDSEKSIPQNIEIDVSSIHLGQKIRAHDVKLPNGVKLIKKDNFLIGSVIGRGKSEEEKTTNPAVAATPVVGTQPAKTDDKKPKAEDKKSDSKK